MRVPLRAFLVVYFAMFGCAAPQETSRVRIPEPATIVDASEGRVIHFQPTTELTTMQISAPLSRVWAALEATYEELGITAEVRDEASGTLGTRRFTQSRLAGQRTTQYLRCGEGAGPSHASSYRLHLTILASLRRAGTETTHLAVQVSGTASPVDGTGRVIVGCATTGALEQRIRSVLASHLAS